MRQNYLTAISVGLMVTVVLSGRAAAQPLPEPLPRASSSCPVTLYFGNGIRTDEAASYASAHFVLGPEVNTSLNSAGRRMLRDYCIDFSYATNNGLSDLVESDRQAGFEVETSFWEMIGGLVPSNGRLADAIREHIDNRRAEEYESSVDLQIQVARYRLQLDSPAKTVVVVAHSQGNFFANEAFRVLTSGRDGRPPINPSQFRIVAVATPAGVVATGDDNHTTLYGDVILGVLGRLNANTDIKGTPCQIDELLGGQFPGQAYAVPCHLFESSYMVGEYSRPKILGHVLENIPDTTIVADDYSFVVNAGDVLRRQVSARFNNIIPVTIDGTRAGGYVQWYFPESIPGLAVEITGALTYDSGAHPIGQPPVSFQYKVHTPFGDSNTAKITIISLEDHTPPGPLPPNQPPVAAFVVTAGAHTAPDHTTFTVVADSITGEALVTFEDRTVDTDGVIVSRAWFADTQVAPLSIGDRIFNWGFRPGRYTIRLDVRDDDGASASTTAVVEVLGQGFSVPVFMTPERGQIGADLIEGVDRWMYGTTESGGAWSAGTVFRVSPAGEFETLHSFNVADGAVPSAGLLLANDGWFYGTARGADGGVLYRVASEGTFEVLHRFDRDPGFGPSHPDPLFPTGKFPIGELLQLADGSLVGVTREGGNAGKGTLYRFRVGVGVDVLHHFDDPRNPTAGVVLGQDGALYGPFESRGFNTQGGIYRFDSSSGFSILHQLQWTDALGVYREGSFIPAELLSASDGSLYGVTQFGGANGDGVVFRQSLDGTFAVIVHLERSATGRGPAASLIELPDGLWGTTTYGGRFVTGIYNAGTIFKVSFDGATSLVHEFDGQDGDRPGAGLLLHSSGALFGSTYNGGPDNHGVIFRFVRP